MLQFAFAEGHSTKTKNPEIIFMKKMILVPENDQLKKIESIEPTAEVNEKTAAWSLVAVMSPLPDVVLVILSGHLHFTAVLCEPLFRVASVGMYTKPFTVAVFKHLQPEERF